MSSKVAVAVAVDGQRRIAGSRGSSCGSHPALAADVSDTVDVRELVVNRTRPLLRHVVVAARADVVVQSESLQGIACQVRERQLCLRRVLERDQFTARQLRLRDLVGAVPKTGWLRG